MQDFKIPVARLIQSSDGLSGAQTSEVNRLARQLASQSGEITRARVDAFVEAQHTPNVAFASTLKSEINLRQHEQFARRSAGIYLAGEGQQEVTVRGGLVGKLEAGLAWVTAKVRPLLVAHSDADALIARVIAGDVNGVRNFKAENGVDGLREIVNRLGADGNAAAILAAFHGQTEILRLLLDAGASLTAVDPVMQGTALHAAAFTGHAQACAVLIQAGIAIDAVGPHNGFTALHDAVRSGHGNAVKAILKGNPDLSIRSADGETALELAQRLGHADIVAVLERETEHRSGIAQLMDISER